MTSTGPTKQEIESVFGRLRSQAANKSCFDCGAKAPTWSSVTYGIFICIDCSAVHRNLGVHLTFVRSTNLDTNWTWLQLRQMQLGGNANASQFFRQHNCTTTDAQQKYNSRAAQLYRDKLQKLAQNAMKQHGTKLHFENQNEKAESEVIKNEEEDFFTLCDENSFETTTLNQKNNNSNDQIAKIESTPKTAQLLNAGEPSVDLLNSCLTNNVPSPAIGARKVQPKKTGIGARKGGLGATKVKTNFAEIEQRANLANQFKDPVPEKQLTEEEELESCASVRLAYQDLSLKQSKEEAKMKTVDPVKAKQMERLGMGFNLRGSDVSHSALSDMETISQTAAPKSSSSSSSSNTKSSFDREVNSDAFDSLLGYSPSMYKTSKQDKELEMMGFESIEPIDSHHSNITSMFASQSANNSTTNKPVSSGNGKSPAPARTGFGYAKNTPAPVDLNEDKAQKKFGSAKGISSDQFFGNEQSSTEVASNLSRFQGSNSISSSDYFNDGSSSTTSNRSSRRGYTTAANFNAPDMDDVKESVRQGVTKVAGRLSNLANDVMSSLQDKYGY